jgi:RNA polymerase sigma-70 factor (ECF subfamily)
VGVSAVLIDSLSRAVTMAGRRSGPPSAMDNGWLVRELVRTGDDDLFRLLVQRYRDRVFRLAVSMLGPGNEAEAEDVAQEVFVLVYRKIDTFRHDSDFSSWIFRMTRNRAIDSLRKARMRHRHVGDEELRSMPSRETCSDPEMAAVAGERRTAVLRHVQRLPDLQRTVVYLHYWIGSGVADIAELLDMNVQTVKSHLHRARRRLALELAAKGSRHV